MSWDWPKWWWINDVFRFLLTASALNFENSFLNTPKIYLSFSSLQHRLLQQFSYDYSCLLDLSNFELTLLKSIWQKFWSFCHFYVKWYQIMKFINIFLFHLPRNHHVDTDTSKRRFWIFYIIIQKYLLQSRPIFLQWEPSIMNFHKEFLLFKLCCG